MSPFEIETGEAKINTGPTYSDVFGNKMVNLALTNPKIAAITAAMPLGTGLEEFSKKYPERFFDVGIAEQHAVTFAAGLAKAGIIPVVAVYSTFMQRSYDQIIHDVALQNLHVVLAIDRAGIVGEDGETHQGLYDISFLNHIPNMSIAAPGDYDEFEKLLDFAVNKFNRPIAIRYPRGSGKRLLADSSEIHYGKGVKLQSGNDISIIAVGKMVECALKVAELLKDKGVSAEIINGRFIKPLDARLILESATKTKAVATIEDNAIKGGFGSSVLELLNQNGFKIKTGTFGFPDIPIVHGSRNELNKKYGLDEESIAYEILKLLKNK
jgi:1-deoxy-D-xylulose-5-phosphate synthase